MRVDLNFSLTRTFSMVLKAVAAADYCFISTEVGAYSLSSDSNVFKNLTLGRLLESNKQWEPCGFLNTYIPI
jgi:hypothetical protein